MQKFSYLKSANAEYIDEILDRYLKDPNSVDESWRYFFEGIELGEETRGSSNGASPDSNGAVPNGHAKTEVSAGLDLNSEAKVAGLINAYREHGRVLANINPIYPAPASHPLLELAHFGLSAADLPKTFSAGKLLGIGPAPLSKIIEALKATYCSSIGVEFTHISDPEPRQWLQKRMEESRNRALLDTATRKFILTRLTESETFERFLHTRYVAQKRFSIEGSESTIPALDCMIEIGAELGAKEFVVGMAHRGRLNVLTHIFGKPPEYIFTEFEGNYKIDSSYGEGDVKYHKGYSADFTTRGGKEVHLSLAANPSHLEFVGAVVEGVARAKQQKRRDQERAQVVPILIHGDAAFAGQGVCYEILNLSELEGYETGGTLHFVINNQVGFTTSPKDSRSTTYSTDLAKMLEVPIFHVNGDDPEAVWYVSKISTEYRQKFKVDVVIDLVSYRKHGHNEGDEPTFTQPLLYKKIKTHPSTREIYSQALTAAGTLSSEEAQAIIDTVTAKLTEAQQRTRAENPAPHTSVFEGDWKGLRMASETECFAPVKTQVSEDTLRELSETINKVPAGFNLHPKLTRFFDGRKNAVLEGKGLDWGNAEALAYATLLHEGHSVRLSGQDAERGTFTHRHSVLNDFETGETYTPLNHLPEKTDFQQGRFMVHNSHLSETAVMGFEYGYSLAAPWTLVIWEAQFGDFANGAQVIIDQFIACSETKWKRMSGLVLLLPHGYEGQGAEHSSARLERFLSLSGRNNMIVCNLTTPAQIFHALRRQIVRDFRKPMIVMSPKSLLRHPQATSPLSDLTDGAFHEAIDDVELGSPELAQGVKRVLLCSGKVYYDLAAERAAKKRTDIAILRVEQLYPFPAEQVAKYLGKYPSAKDLVWVQEEPRNMGAWQHVYGMWDGGLEVIRDRKGIDGRTIRYIGREVAAAPAVGSAKLHEVEQKALIEKAFGE